MPLQFDDRGEEQTEEENIQHWLKKSHEDLVILFFASTWSGSSQLLKEYLYPVQKDYPHDIYFLTLNIEGWPRAAEQFQVYSVPEIIFLQRGEVVEHLQGVVSKSIFAHKLESLLEDLNN